MDSCSALPSPIAEALANGTTVLTANQRAARTLLHAYDSMQQAAGLAHWHPPAIFAWDTWLDSLWHRLLVEGKATDLLLSTMQEHILWRAIIADDPAMAGLQTIDALATTAGEAWGLLHRYSCRELIARFAGNSDTRAFSNWAKIFARRCGRSGYITQAQLPEIVSGAVIRREIELPGSVMLVGFDSTTPAQAMLLDTLRAAGVAVAEHSPDKVCDEVILTNAPDQLSEIAHCARWVDERLKQRPEQCVAVIVPSLNTWRFGIERRLRDEVAPWLNDLNASSASTPYEFSLGIALAHTPLVQVALDVLRWVIGPLPLERITNLLLSSHFAGSPGAEDEILARAELDAFVVRRQHLLEPSFTYRQLLRLASESDVAERVPFLIQHLREFAALAGRRNLAAGTRTCAEWAQMFHDLLSAAGFGRATADSNEFQAWHKWQAALDELTTLDFDNEIALLDFAGALDAITRIAQATLFAPETHHAAIQVLGPLEAAGSTFDAIWFLQADDTNWHPHSAPNPLLPWLLQRELKMPGADTAHDTDYARRITSRIANSAPMVVFSYAHESTEGLQRPSAALRGLPLTKISAASFSPARLPATPIALDSIIDSSVIPSPPNHTLPGGAGILVAQAACGFRAFAEKRLFSSALDTLALGLDPSERGNLIHAVLEDFWGVVRTQEELRRMTTAEREAQLYRSIDGALQRNHIQPAAGWPLAYIDAERGRVANLLLQFIDYEATRRSPFAVRLREEQVREVHIGPLQIDVRVDRVDTVVLTAADGSTTTGEIIIDYKTGPTALSGWHGDRPDAPQLPLYAVVSNAEMLAGIAYAAIRPGKEMGMHGYEAETGVLPKSSRPKAATLAAQVEEWRVTLESLAEDFYRGDATVSPKRFPATCKYCTQRLLCRLDLSTLTADETDSETNGSLDTGANLG